MVNNKIIQPETKGHTLSKPRFNFGGKRSVERLKQLDFDPIGALVESYNKIQKDLEFYEAWRDGEIVMFTATGKPRNYNAEAHLALYDKMIKIGEALLRYGYGRVPENVEENGKTIMPLVVNLTKKGESYSVNDYQPDDNEMFHVIEGEFYGD
jgi:hypothetical protein